MLFNCDCMEALKTLPTNSVDLVVTDPPYLLDTCGGGNFTARKKIQVLTRGLENGFDIDTVLPELLRLQPVCNMIIFCSNKQISKLMSFFESRGISADLLIWHKTNSPPLCSNAYVNDIEYVVYAHGKGAFFNNAEELKIKYRVFESRCLTAKEKQHPTQKNLEHIKQFIRLHSKEGDTVLDPFMGSGTTGVACKLLGRRFIGCEIREDYFKIAKQRVEDG